MNRDQFYQAIQDMASTYMNQGRTLEQAYEAISEQVKDLSPKVPVGFQSIPKKWAHEETEDLLGTIGDLMSDHSNRELIELYTHNWTEQDWVDYRKDLTEE